jgi:hypothetical protein
MTGGVFDTGCVVLGAKSREHHHRTCRGALSSIRVKEELWTAVTLLFYIYIYIYIYINVCLSDYKWLPNSHLTGVKALIHY